MVSLAARLQALKRTISAIYKISGIAGVSVGVASQGQGVYQAGFGFSDVAAGTAPNKQTIFTLGSLTKGLVSAMVGILVQDKKLSWDSRMRDILAAHDSLWFLSDNRIEMKRSDAIPTVNYLPSVHPLHAGYC